MPVRSDDAALVKRCLEQGGLDQLQAIVRIVTACGGLDYTRGLALTEIEHALQALSVLPSSIYRTALEDMARLALNRSA